MMNLIDCESNFNLIGWNINYFLYLVIIQSKIFKTKLQ